jgi:hypothetical protein
MMDVAKKEKAREPGEFGDRQKSILKSALTKERK